ncbi:hypothetical protein JRQ81_007864 [Phrynocephalus forsythii]|uniref:Uncharacterized protein n=1 Tax=Phrynocephalus forsythii TaxID=171643 RepID=A0A9Q1B763_9SAUR|nr:hypothetical protein JRQ81_007864 [Phrynocephalus forsythii]
MIPTPHRPAGGASGHGCTGLEAPGRKESLSLIASAETPSTGGLAARALGSSSLPRSPSSQVTPREDERRGCQVPPECLAWELPLKRERRGCSPE